MKWRKLYKEANEIKSDFEDWDMFVVNIGWAGPEGYDDIEDDEAYRAWEKFIEDNDLPVCVGMKLPKGMDVDIKHVLEKQYRLPVKDYDIDRSKGAMEFQSPWLVWTPEGWQETDEVELVSESNEVNLKKLLRQNGVTKLPSGTKLSYDGKLEWSKHKGYAGQKTIRNMCIQLEHAGWKRGDWTTGGTPDGSSVANSNNYTSPDGRILMSYTEHYGCTSYDNSFYITFKLAESPANESDDWVGDDGGVEDDINPKFADLRDAFDKIDDRGFQWSSGKWRIRPDELGYDWKIYYDGEGWIGTVNYKTREYDVWNTKVVKKHEIKDFLHACAADSFKPMDTVSESTIKGTGRVDFDDDLVAVYTPDGKLEYKGLFDDCPYKDEPMQYDRKNMVYRFEGENGDYRTMVKIA